MQPLAPFESSIAERYHEETKYTEAGLRAEETSYPPLDFEEQPVPFREVDGPRVLLPSQGLPLERRGAAEPDTPPAPAGRMDLAKLARILWHTNGCTRIAHHAGGVHHFRAAPSAGAMYPTEVYVAVRDIDGIEPGVYDYQLLDHSLAAVWTGDPLPHLRTALFGHPALEGPQAVILLTGVWHRSSWRYRERGYRRVLLDSGHVLGNLVEAAPAEGFTAVPVAAFRDEVLETLVAADPVREGVLAAIPLLDRDAAANVPVMPQRSSPTVEWHQALDAVGTRVSKRLPEHLIAALHLAARIDEGAPASPLAAPPEPVTEGHLLVDAGSGPTSWTESEPVTETIAARRSTRAFREAPVPREALFRALGHALPDGDVGLFAPAFMRTYLVAMNTVGLPPGCYLYESGPRHLVELDRSQHARAMHHMGLGQRIFVDAAAALVHTADLTRAVACYGDRAYRLLGLDAGHIGERLNLALLREGVGVSGCAGYFDDEMNRVLRIPESHAVIYITTIGMPL